MSEIQFFIGESGFEWIPVEQCYKLLDFFMNLNVRVHPHPHMFWKMLNKSWKNGNQKILEIIYFGISYCILPHGKITKHNRKCWVLLYEFLAETRLTVYRRLDILMHRWTPSQGQRDFLWLWPLRTCFSLIKPCWYENVPHGKCSSCIEVWLWLSMSTSW